MKIHFEVNLLSDIILNQKSASEGPNTTLDFIPGSNFMGIVAGALYKELEQLDLNGSDKCEIEAKKQIIQKIIHSGEVRFGDAHVGRNKTRGYKVPASMFYPKLKSPEQVLFINHCIPLDDNTQNKVKELQLKQCRNGFFVYDEDKFIKLATSTDFAIKSAYDRSQRRASDSQMYGYQSINTPYSMYFEVECDQAYATIIRNALEGEKRVGRSRASQYGLVSIKAMSAHYKECSSLSKSGIIAIYAESRLCFIDKSTGMPTFRPTIEQLGINTGRIRWDMSQIRTVQYSPWNFHRQCFDTDRCCIEKGSVIIVEGVEDCPKTSAYIGVYNNEGLGKIVYNPDFLEADTTSGMALHTLSEDKEPPMAEKSQATNSPDILIAYLEGQKTKEDNLFFVYEQVAEWIDKNKGLFLSKKKETFASQWGAIRSIATLYKTADEINNQLFYKTKIKSRYDLNNEKQEKIVPNAYLTHGVAKEKWGRERLNAFKHFCTEELESLNDEFFRFAVINLAAEMAKRCRQ